jgi:hypothetical protein
MRLRIHWRDAARRPLRGKRATYIGIARNIVVVPNSQLQMAVGTVWAGDKGTTSATFKCILSAHRLPRCYAPSFSLKNAIVRVHESSAAFSS